MFIGTSIPLRAYLQQRLASRGIVEVSGYEKQAALAGGRSMNPFRDQLRQVLRRLGRAPMFTAITLITLAAGVGANTVVFSVLEGVLLKPLPYPHAQELVGVWRSEE